MKLGVNGWWTREFFNNNLGDAIMNRILISILFSSIIFFVGCDDGTISNSSNDYTIENMVGTWNVISNNMDMTMAFDFNTVFLYMLDEYNCVLMGGTYEDDNGDVYYICDSLYNNISTTGKSMDVYIIIDGKEIF